MTKEQAIFELSQLPENAEIYLSYPDGTIGNMKLETLSGDETRSPVFVVVPATPSTETSH